MTPTPQGTLARELKCSAEQWPRPKDTEPGARGGHGVGFSQHFGSAYCAKDPILVQNGGFPMNLKAKGHRPKGGYRALGLKRRGVTSWELAEGRPKDTNAL